MPDFSIITDPQDVVRALKDGQNVIAISNLVMETVLKLNEMKPTEALSASMSIMMTAIIKSSNDKAAAIKITDGICDTLKAAVRDIPADKVRGD